MKNNNLNVMPVLGLSREDEEKHLKDVLAIADENVKKAKASIQKYKDELDDLLEVYETSDKEALALWHNSRSMLNESKKEVLRVERARKKPFFGRIDFKDPKAKVEESYYIGKVGISRTPSEPEVIDWRAPIASVYYESNLGPCRYVVQNEAAYTIDLTRKRTYEIQDDKLVDFFDSDVVATDELLTKYLAKSKKNVLGEIIATIQKEQNAIIRNSPRNNILVQGVAGSGKTTVAMHRISYILYNFEDEFRPEDFYIIGSNRILLNYITSVLPDLDVYGAKQMTMEQLFTRLMYEDWDDRLYSIRSLDKSDVSSTLKGRGDWFKDLEAFCERYEKTQIPAEDVILQKNGHLLIGPNVINTYLKENPLASMQSKILMLNEILVSKVENEVQGKGVSFSAREKQSLFNKYSQYFGKDDWKGSIFDLYHDFLVEQNSNGKKVAIPDKEFDLYDLAALAYLYKRIKEIDPIREASHVVIDEAQDFGMMAYNCLVYCMRGCTYTIMGDVSQNIHYGFGLNDWEDLKKLVLTGTYDAFGLLKKSYRNTIEISNFATDILKHGNFAIYPVEPIVRHGDGASVTPCSSDEEMLEETLQTISHWQLSGLETIAVITRTAEQAKEASEKLLRLAKEKSLDINLIDSNLETSEFGNGVMVLPVALTKGLEFDAVILYDASKENYPLEDSHVKLLYVACTRALHKLSVFHKGDLTDLIATKAPLEKHMELLKSEDEKKPIAPRVIEKTQEEIHEELTFEGDKDMAERNYIGPRRIVVKDTPESLDRSFKLNPSPGKSVMEDSPTTKPSVQKIKKNPVKSTVSASSMVEKVPEVMNPSRFAFGDMPEDSAMRVPGHTRVDNGIRWVKKEKDFVDIASNYGVLRVQPVNDHLVLVRFRKGQIGSFTQLYPKFEPDAVLKDKKIAEWGIHADSPLNWSVKEQREFVEMKTGAFSIRCQKKSGALSFFKGADVFLCEKPMEPRFINSSQNGGVYEFFGWAKNEKLDARGILNTDLSRVTMKARYISFGQKPLRMPWLLSEKGYQIGIAAPSTVMFCGIPSFGPYIFCEDTAEINYYIAVR